MRSRLRPLAALLALCALSLSFAGSAWAAMCQAGVPDAPVPADAARGHAGHGAHHGHAPAPAPAEREPAGEREAPACPLMAPGAASCLGSFVGADVAARAAPPVAEAHDFAAPRGVHGLQDPSPPFRPPEA
ncbi:MAG TPA: hypothetical protein VF615_11405 [Longimicrobiaceae bacterium]|jgi:hypothetical protein